MENYLSKALLVFGILIGSNGLVKADDWGCKVLLCVANPNGWSTVPACHPPMQRLFACLATFSCTPPTCASGGGSKPRQQKYVNCPNWYTGRQVSENNCIRKELDWYIKVRDGNQITTHWFNKYR